MPTRSKTLALSDIWSISKTKISVEKIAVHDFEVERDWSSTWCDRGFWSLRTLQCFNLLHLNTKYASSPFYSLYISCGTWKENLSNSQDLIDFVNLSFIIITSVFDSGVIILGEMRWSPLLRVQRLTHNKGPKLKSFHLAGNWRQIFPVFFWPDTFPSG